MIALVPEYDRSCMPGPPDWTPLEQAPTYVRSSGATRWHRARSGRRWHSGRVSYSYWCGPNYGDMGAEVIGRREEVCATCEGRWRAQTMQRWVFTPRKSLPPTRCPASRREDMVPAGQWRHFPCPVCGDLVNARAVSRWYPGAAVQIHTSGPGLIAPCRWHGWSRLTLNGARAVCGCQLQEARHA
jgi:predicted RNA-binding Zn-ribbon protein involved in translation (DUF1610 family)